MSTSLPIPIIGCSLLFLAMVKCQQDLLNGCKSFDAFAYIKPYNTSQEAMLVDHYFSDFSPKREFKVVYAQRGSCQQHSKCVRASSSAFSTCSAFETISKCIGNTGWPTFVFENCKGDRCELTMSPNATKCHYGQWRKVPAADAKPCTHDLNDNMLKYRPMANLNALNGTHCLLPLPKGSKIYKQIKCNGEKKDIPYFTWAYEFSHSLSEGNYSCLLRSRCMRMEHPLDFVCISGENSASILRKAAEKRMAIDIATDEKSQNTTENIKENTATQKKIQALVAGKPENSARRRGNTHLAILVAGTCFFPLLWLSTYSA